MVAVAAILLAGVVSCSSSSAQVRATSTTSTTSTIAPEPPSTAAAPAGAEVTQPPQPTSGPGSSDLAHRGWKVSSGGIGADAWYVFEPTSPRPRSAPLAVVLHGYYEFDGYASMYELIRHTVLGGSVVIYPRWQIDVAAPCPGPIDVEPCVQSSVAGIRGALDFLAADPTRVQPDLARTSYLGFSFGGILTANLANRWDPLDLPEPKAIFLDDPHDGGIDGPGEPALDDSMTGIPATVLLECHQGAEGVIAEDPTGGCNALFRKLGHIPAAGKAIVSTVPDAHGLPALSSRHGVCAARKGEADAYDWNFCWKVWDDLRSAVRAGEPPAVAIGDSAAHTGNGRWSDGTPIAPLAVQHGASLGP
ncbi:alpha/beta hydrolase fold domain-containing protein [soil metagenome]